MDRGEGEPGTIQSQVEVARAMVLGGRGTGVSQTEIDQHTRGRPTLGDQPTSRHLASVAHQTALASGDTAAIALDLATAREDLQSTVRTLHDRASPRRRTTGKGPTRRHRRRLWAVATVAVALLLCHQRMPRPRKRSQG